MSSGIIEAGKRGLVAIEGIHGFAIEATYCLQHLGKHNSYPQNKPVICTSEDFGRTKLMGNTLLVKNSQAPLLDQYACELAERARLTERVIRPALMADKLVVCKNFTTASRVNCRLKFPEESWPDMFRQELDSRGSCEHDRVKPVLTIFVDIIPSVASERMKAKGVENLRNVAYYRKQRSYFFEEFNLLRSNGEQVIIICGDHSTHKVYLDIVNAINCIE
jgi:thymidylate kinase